MEPNPYQSPHIDRPVMPTEAPKVPDTFLAWERLRIWFNAVLVVAVLLGSMPAPQNMLTTEAVSRLLEGIIVVNLAFSVGMLVEFYLRWFGWWRNWMRMGLFLLGTGPSFLATLAVTVVMITGGV
jgi:hypothetical protein